MPSLILKTAARYLVPLLIMFSVFLLLRGHDAPGGGFVGGLVVANAVALYIIGFGVDDSRQDLRVDPRYLIGVGLLLILVSGLIGLVVDETFLIGIWDTHELPLIGKPGTPLLFDIGVEIVVIGVTMLIIFSLAEAQE